MNCSELLRPVLVDVASTVTICQVGVADAQFAVQVAIRRLALDDEP
mgnify:CR=1 FL=1